MQVTGFRGFLGVHIGVIEGYIMEKKMETTTWGLGLRIQREDCPSAGLRALLQGMASFSLGS